MIAEKSKDVPAGQSAESGGTRADTLPQIAPPGPPPDWEALSAQIRSDANDDPIFYLVRSNTGSDGE